MASGRAVGGDPARGDTGDGDAGRGDTGGGTAAGGTREALREALKLTAVALKRGDVPFALVGGYAAWARGAPEPVHDADFMVVPDDAERAAAAITEAGLVVERPPEDWLFKVRLPGAAGSAGGVGGAGRAGGAGGAGGASDGSGVFVDVLWRLFDAPVEPDLLERCDVMPVLSVQMPVLAATDVLSGKLTALGEHYCDFASLLPVARALREQVDWPRVRRDVAHNPYAVALLFLLERLGVVDREPSGGAGGATPEG